MSPTSGTSRIVEGLFHRAPASVLFLAFGLGLNARVSMSQVGLASQNPRVQESQQRSDSDVERTQEASQGTLPANNPKPVLTDGTAVHLKFVRAVASSQVIAGEKVPLEVVEPVLAGKLVAIPQHSAEEAIVTMAQAGRSMARGGNLQLKIENVRLADGELVPVRAVKDVEGGGRKALMIATLPFWSFDLKGKNATVPAGAEITAYIAGDFPLDASKFQVAGASPQQKDLPK
jgi:hypothetical protein